MARGACRSIGASRRLKLPADAPPGRLKCLGELVIQGALEARASGAFVQVPSMASSCTRPPVHASVCMISSPGRPKRAGSSPGASACRRALGPRRLVGAAGRGGTCCAGSGRSGRWIRNVGRPARLGRSAAQARHGADPVDRSAVAPRAPPPGAGSRRHRPLRGRRHLPGRQHLFSPVDRCAQPLVSFP